MPASEPIGQDRRWALKRRLHDVLGEEEARTLMDSLPPVAWDRIATKDDLKDTNDAIEVNRAAIESNRAAIESNRAAIADNRAAIESNRAAIEACEQRLRSEMHAGFANIRAEMAAEFKMLRAENTAFQGQIALQLAKQTRTFVFTLLAFAVPTWGSILAFGIS